MCTRQLPEEIFAPSFEFIYSAPELFFQHKKSIWVYVPQLPYFIAYLTIVKMPLKPACDLKDCHVSFALIFILRVIWFQSANKRILQLKPGPRTHMYHNTHVFSPTVQPIISVSIQWRWYDPWRPDLPSWPGAQSDWPPQPVLLWWHIWHLLSTSSTFLTCDNHVTTQLINR